MLYYRNMTQIYMFECIRKKEKGKKETFTDRYFDKDKTHFIRNKQT